MKLVVNVNLEKLLGSSNGDNGEELNANIDIDIPKKYADAAAMTHDVIAAIKYGLGKMKGRLEDGEE